ncbi:uncharacterized protein LOC113272490 [Papaver somniferum]|uniref:uncharacterized protein LOC113272490 n=1 Tax=Papaver somniferum TaxID=3469 RepID=UPI000E7037F0|nr:uncharacterized protein LOC113272490 [Papaver somniferum]
MEKAIDNVNWQALFCILHKHGFEEKWIDWIRWCVSSSHLSVLVNGGSTEKLKPSKGLKQGDSLSTYLFLLVVEILSKLINDAGERGQIHGFRVAKLLNLEKSIMVSVNADDVIEVLEKELGCKTERLPIQYLGLPIGANSRCISIWDSVLEKMALKLATWKRKYLNKAGRLVLIKHCLSSILFTIKNNQREFLVKSSGGGKCLLKQTEFKIVMDEAWNVETTTCSTYIELGHDMSLC